MLQLYVAYFQTKQASNTLNKNLFIMSSFVDQKIVDSKKINDFFTSTSCRKKTINLKLNISKFIMKVCIFFKKILLVL